MSWHPVVLSIQVTVVASLLIVVVGLPLALFLARARFPGQTVLETVINLPLVLPPSVIGYYLLLALGRGSPIVEWFGVQVLFTWQAAAIASAVV
jgi:molybdate transport system permease protein